MDANFAERKRFLYDLGQLIQAKQDSSFICRSHGILEQRKFVALKTTWENDAGSALKEFKLSVIFKVYDGRQAHVFVVVLVEICKKLDWGIIQLVQTLCKPVCIKVIEA